MRVPFSPHPWQHLLFFVSLIIVILAGVRWNLSVVLICIFFMARDVENFFLFFSFLFFFLGIWTSVFEKWS
jgi:hypothetical protein